MTDILPLDALALGGDAVGRRSPVVFVPYGAPGDKVVLERVQARKNHARGFIQKIEEPSPHRAAPPCPYFFKPGAPADSFCGGCDWQHLDYSYQLQAKRQLVRETFERIGKFVNPPIGETLGAAEPKAAWRYRNKVQIPFAPGPDGGLSAGFYAPGSHRIIPFDDCLIQTEVSVRIFKAARDWFEKRRIPAYNEDTHQGWLRHLLVRTNEKNEALVAVIAHNSHIPSGKNFTEELTRQCPEVVGIHLNINPRRDHVILGDQWKHLWGQKTLVHTILGLQVPLSPGAFFQVNHAMAEALYSEALRLGDPQPEQNILELYAGVGVMAQIFAKKARRVWAVEENPQAVVDGRASAQMNSINNVTFVAGRCEQVLGQPRFRKTLADVFHTVILDPPRAGCDATVLGAVLGAKPEKIVYVSCDPATLARDARLLADGGYNLAHCTPVDLFHQTSHIESVTLFSKK